MEGGLDKFLATVPDSPATVQNKTSLCELTTHIQTDK